jgi:hypothetical protein
MYCLSMNPNHLKMIKNLGYIPVGLGKNKFSKDWLTDKKLKNISKKNKYYGEYTFHYWLWKNNIIKHNDWIGFCQYRKFWIKPSCKLNDKNFLKLNQSLLKKIPLDIRDHEVILGRNYYINQLRFSKFIKHNLKTMIMNPRLWFDKKKRNLRFHFDMWHGKGNLDKAISLLEHKEREGFRKFVNTKVAYNPHNMFICKNKKILFRYYESVFPWLEKCEKIFGFKKLKGYGLQRLYGFLAERYMSYWFQKYNKFAIIKIHFKDLSDYY